MAELQIRKTPAQVATDVFDPPDDGLAGKVITGDAQLKIRPAPGLQVRPPALQIRPPAAAAPAVAPPLNPPQQSKAGSMLGDLASSVANRAVVKPVTDAMAFTKENFQEGVKNITNPETATVPNLSGNFNPRLSKPMTAADIAKPKKPDVEAPVLTQLKRPLGAIQAATAPMFAAGHGLVSKPIEEATGGKIPAEWVDLVRMWTPAAAGLIGGAAGRVAKIPAVAKVLAPVKANETVQKGAKAIESIFSPTSMSKEAKAAEGAVREARGLAERDTARAQAQVNAIAKEVNQSSPQDQSNLVHYIETRSKGGTLANPNLQRAADTLRKVYQDVRTKLENTEATEKMGFVQDYFVHQWQDAKKAQTFVQEWVGKAGSAKSTRARSVPTMQDGIKAGLVPLHANPLDATMHYVGNMQNYLALKEIQADLKAQKLRKFFAEGKQDAGWVELQGPGNRQLISFTDKKGNAAAASKVAYAPEDAARIYNRYYSPGFSGRTGDLYKMLRTAVNAPTQIILGLSGYHYRLIAGEQMSSAFAEGFGKAMRGDIKGAAKSVAKGVPVVGAAMAFRKGGEVAAQSVGKAGKLDPAIVETISRAGGRTVGIDKSLKASESDNFWDAWKKGTLKAEAKADLKGIKDAGMVAGIPKTFGVFAKNVGKLMDTVAYPLFAKTIPNIKNAVNYDGIADWVKSHPGASQAEITAAARDIVDSTDNRFGEMIQDNIFWDKKLKQSLQLMVLSVGWDIGTVREVAGGTKDLARSIAGNGELTPRAKYIIGAPIAHMLNAAVYQYIKTGQGPQSPQDLVYPRTGGTTTQSPGTKYERQVPERLRLPSQMNDVIGYQEDPLRELENKMAPVWKIAGAMATNSDWRGDPISYQYMQNAPHGVKAYAEYILKSLTPISASAIAKRGKGSNIGWLEKAILGSNPAGMRARDPEGFEGMMKKNEMAREKKGMKHRATAE